MEPGAIISFKCPILGYATAKVLRIIQCPLNRHEPKALVEHLGERYGIPFSEILTTAPGSGVQLTLF